MVRRVKKDPQNAQEAPVVVETSSTDVEVLLIKKTWLNGQMVEANEIVTVPERIATVLRAKGIIK